jgi:4-hydroxybutyryl-CoA dehydratase / vinylacetyl-CoA-Delta-isomerase
VLVEEKVLNGSQYLQSLDDNRQTFFEGQEVKNIAGHPVLGVAAGNVASTYERFYDPAEGSSNPVMSPPRSVDELRARIPLLRSCDVVTRTTFGSLMALLTAAERLSAAGVGRVETLLEYQAHAVAGDVRITECITDAKGDRSLPPRDQPDQDAYLRVVDQSADGIVIRGAKLHITGASMSHDLMVMPTKRMKDGEDEYSVACAVPVNSAGVKIINSSYAPRAADSRHFPYSSQHHMPDGFVVFEDVFVPSERVFLSGEGKYAAVFAHSLGLWERIGGTAGMAEQADLLVGLAHLIADANGLLRVSHVREKISEIVIHATLIRAGLEAALTHAVSTPDGFVHPNELYTNAAKYYGAANYSLMVRHLHDIAGGSVLTAPTIADLENPATAGIVTKYMAGRKGVRPEHRLRLFHAIRDLTADSLGGWHTVTNVQSGGGLYAQRIVALGQYDLDAAREQALQAAGITDWD